MSRRKASIKDRGVDILFGAGLPPVEGPRPRRQVEREREEKWISTLAAEAEAAVAEPELVGLEGEAAAGAPSPPVVVRPAEEMPPESVAPRPRTPPPRPEEQELPEAAFRPPPPQEVPRPRAMTIPSPAAAPPPSARAEPVPIPTSPQVRPSPPKAEALPPPGQAGQAQPVSMPRVISPFSETGVPYGEMPTVLPGPGVAEEEREEEAVPSAALEREEEEQVVMERVGRRRQNQLFREIDDLYERIEAELSGSVMAQKAATALKRLRLARDILMENPRQFDEAEYQISQVRLLLARTVQSHEQASRYGMKLFLYEVAWFLLLMACVIFNNQLARGLVLATGMQLSQVQDLLVPLMTTMMWGGIGGVLGALYSLRWHISQVQDFDKEYNIWYLANPFMGIVLGGIVYLMFRAGFLAVQGTTGATNWLPSVVACLVGFREKFALELLDRLIRVIASGPEAPEEEKVELGRASASTPSPPSS